MKTIPTSLKTLKGLFFPKALRTLRRNAAVGSDKGGHHLVLRRNPRWHLVLAQVLLVEGEVSHGGFGQTVLCVFYVVVATIVLWMFCFLNVLYFVVFMMFADFGLPAWLFSGLN